MFREEAMRVLGFCEGEKRARRKTFFLRKKKKKKKKKKQKMKNFFLSFSLESPEKTEPSE